MAKAELQDFLSELHGKMSKDGTIVRQKQFHAPDGTVIKKGKHEAFVVMYPRDYKRNPPKGSELANINAFGQASKTAKLIILSGTYTPEQIAQMPEEERARQQAFRIQLEDFQKRFIAQLKKPDPQAPLLPESDPNYKHGSSSPQRRQYATLATFIRAMLLQQAKGR